MPTTGFLSTLFCLAASLASAAKLSVAIPSSPLLPNPAGLPASTHAVLLGPAGVRHDVPIRRDSTFLFPDLGEASYLLTIHARDFFFPPLRVDVSRNATSEEIQAWQTFRGNEWSHKGAAYGTGSGELHVAVKPLSQKSFYQTRGGFNILGFLRSPMILMGLFSVVMIFGMPYLLNNMDPETKAEMEEMQKNSVLGGSGNPAAAIQNFDFASWMAGRSTDAGGSSTKK